MRAVVGITLCLDDRERWRAGRSYHYVDASYARAIRDAGGIPMYLPIQREARRAVDQVDGVLIPGGDDLLPPTPYPAGVEFDPAPAEQLAFDRGVLRAALDSGIPVLGICYGMQLIALECGGTLHYDLATDLPGAAEHKPDDPEAGHEVDLEGGTRLAVICGKKQLTVNTHHHQAVAEPGERLRVSARAPDGVIEAIELRSRAFCLGVQWHPERLRGPDTRALFGEFIRACEDGPPRS